MLFTRFLALAGTADMFTELIGDWALNPLLLVIAMSIIYLILGMFLDPLGMMLLTIPVFVPMFSKLGLDLVWFGVLVVKYIGIGLLTPPVGFNIYVVAGATGIDPEHDLPRLLLVPGVRGVRDDAADRVPADLALAAERDELAQVPLIPRSGRSTQSQYSQGRSFARPSDAPRRSQRGTSGRYDQPPVTSSNSSSTANSRGMIFCSTEYCITSSSGLRSASTPNGWKSMPSVVGGIAALLSFSMRKISRDHVRPRVGELLVDAHQVVDRDGAVLAVPGERRLFRIRE